jgi:hypothetical protein
VCASTLEKARGREAAVVKDRDETIERVQHQLDDGSRRAAADIAELRQAREWAELADRMLSCVPFWLRSHAQYDSNFCCP